MKKFLNECVETRSLHNLAVIAAKDFAQILKSHRYVAHYKYMHTYRDKNRCYVSFSGAILDKTLKLAPVNDGTDVNLEYFNAPIREALMALDDLRGGYPLSAYQWLGHRLPKSPPTFFSGDREFESSYEGGRFLKNLQAFLPKLKQFEKSIGILGREKL